VLEEQRLADAGRFRDLFCRGPLESVCGKQ
jgi:hypothetical protein